MNSAFASGSHLPVGAHLENSVPAPRASNFTTAVKSSPRFRPVCGKSVPPPPAAAAISSGPRTSFPADHTRKTCAPFAGRSSATSCSVPLLSGIVIPPSFTAPPAGAENSTCSRMFSGGSAASGGSASRGGAAWRANSPGSRRRVSSFIKDAAAFRKRPRPSTCECTRFPPCLPPFGDTYHDASGAYPQCHFAPSNSFIASPIACPIRVNQIALPR